jgi:hypothetical protein
MTEEPSGALFISLKGLDAFHKQQNNDLRQSLSKLMFYLRQIVDIC